MSTASFHGTINSGCLDPAQALSDLTTTRNGGGTGVSQLHGIEGGKDDNAVGAGAEEQSCLLQTTACETYRSVLLRLQLPPVS